MPGPRRPLAAYTRSGPGLDRHSRGCAITSSLFFLLLSFGFGDRPITGLGIRDLPITIFPAAVGGGKLGASRTNARPEYNGIAVVVNHVPSAGFLECAGQRRIGGQQHSVHTVLFQILLPL